MVITKALRVVIQSDAERTEIDLMIEYYNINCAPKEDGDNEHKVAGEG